MTSVQYSFQSPAQDSEARIHLGKKRGGWGWSYPAQEGDKAERTRLQRRAGITGGLRKNLGTLVKTSKWATRPLTAASKFKKSSTRYIGQKSVLM